MIQVGLISDTHGYLDPAVFHFFKDVDEIWHAGDIGSWEVWDALKKFKPLFGVYGNIDGNEFRQELEENWISQRAGLTILMTHIGGRPGKYPQRVQKLLLDVKPDLFICGHSHILKVVREDRFFYLNPGAAGKIGFHTQRTLLRFSLHQQKIHNLEVIELVY
ncbi:MAG: metallophosphoesterase family protein [Spirosomataceae bacterium]